MDYDFKKIQIEFDNIKNKYPNIWDNLIDYIEERKNILDYYENKIKNIKKEFKS
jgi:hypothetical protein